MLVHTRTQRNPKRTPKNLNNPSANRNEAPNEPQIVHTFAIKHDSQAFFLQAKAVRKNKYSTVKSALWQSQHQTIGRKYNTQQPALRQDAYSIALQSGHDIPEQLRYSLVYMLRQDPHGAMKLREQNLNIGDKIMIRSVYYLYINLTTLEVE